MSLPVREFMTCLPQTVGRDIDVAKAHRMMTQFSCQHLPVLNGSQLVGIVSNTGIPPLQGDANIENIKVEEVMMDEPIIVSPNEDVFQVAKMMEDLSLDSVVVSGDERTPWGILTMDDVPRFLARASAAV